MRPAYLSLVRDEMRSDKVIKIERSMINSYFKELYSIITEARRAGRLAEEYLAKYVMKNYEDAYLLTQLRFIKTATGLSIEENSFDYKILMSIRRMIELISRYLAGYYLLTPEGKIVVQVKKDAIIDGVRYRKGDLITLDINDLVFYTILDLVKPVESLVASIVARIK